MQGGLLFLQTIESWSKHIAENMCELTYVIRPGLSGTFLILWGLKEFCRSATQHSIWDAKSPGFFQIIKIRYFWQCLPDEQKGLRPILSFFETMYHFFF